MEIDEEKIKEDKSLIFENEYLDYLIGLKTTNRPGFVRAKTKLKALKIPMGDLNDAIRAREIQKATEELEKMNEEEIPLEITEKAMEILKHGDPLQYMADACGLRVLGADKAFKKLCCCVAVQDVIGTQGLHPKISGESGMGKSMLCYVFAHILPNEMKVLGSMSNMAAFYHNRGNKLFRLLDDYRAGNIALDQIIKTTSTKFHDPYKYDTVSKVDGTNKGIVLFIGSEQTWAITSVNSGQDIQVLNRQIPINVDESKELTKQVNRKTLDRYGIGAQKLYSDTEEIQVCREMWRILRAEGDIGVAVPFIHRVEWIDTSNRRDTSMFADMLVAVTAMRRFQRDKDPQTNEYLATIDDFNTAYELFSDIHAEELVHKMTAAENNLAQVLAIHPDGLTPEEAGDLLGITATRVRQLALGENRDEVGGLSQKLSGFKIIKVADTVMRSNGSKRTIQKTIYRLDNYDPISGYEAIVVLHPEDYVPLSDSDKKDGDKGEEVRIYYSDGKRFKAVLDEEPWLMHEEAVDINATRPPLPEEMM